MSFLAKKDYQKQASDNKIIKFSLMIAIALAIFLSSFIVPVMSSYNNNNKDGVAPPAPELQFWYDGWDHIYYNVTQAYYLCNISLTLNDAVIGTVDLEFLQLEEQSYRGNFTLNLFAFFKGEFQIKVVQGYGVPPAREYFVYYSEKKTIFSPAYLILIVAGAIAAIIVAVTLIYRVRHGEERRLTKKVLSELERLS